MYSDTNANYESYLDLANRSYTLTYKVTDGTTGLGPGTITIEHDGPNLTYTIYVVNLAASNSEASLTISGVLHSGVPRAVLVSPVLTTSRLRMLLMG